MKTYKIPSYVPAPERQLIILNIDEFLTAYKQYYHKSIGGTFDTVLEKWFDEEYRYNEIPQGEEFYGSPFPIEVEFPDSTSKRFEIPVVGKGFDESELDLVKRMKDFDILIRGVMEWSGGTWNTFTIELDDDEDFDAKKIKAVGEYGLIINYTYDGEEFISEEDWELSDGDISVSGSIFYDGSLHEINLENLKNELEEKGIETLDSDAILNHLIKKIKNKGSIPEFDAGIEVTPGKHWTVIYEEALLLHPEDMRMAAENLNLEYETFKEKVFEDLYLKKLWGPELKESSEIQDSENVNKIKSIIEEFGKDETLYFTNLPDLLQEYGYDVEPYNIMTAIIKIKLKNRDFNIALKYKCNKKADFVVGKFAGWSDIE